MKNFKIKQVPLSRNADIKIRIRLYIATYKKNFQLISLIKIAIPTLMVWIFAIGIFQFMNSEDIQVVDSSKSSLQANKVPILDYLKEVRSDKYRSIAKKRAHMQRAKKYKSYTYIRLLSLRER